MRETDRNQRAATSRERRTQGTSTAATIPTIQQMSVPMSKSDCRVRARKRINRIPWSPSAERNGGGHSSDFDSTSDTARTDGRTVEDPSGLPSLPDLLDELECESVDLSALEQLTQTLLEDIARDLESAAQKTADQEPSAASGKDIPDKVVGPPPKHLEPSRVDLLKPKTEEPRNVIRDISEYLLLHHNYAKTPCKETPVAAPKKLKAIRPKVATPKPKKAPLIRDTEVVYGTFDENTNTITILVNEDSVPVNEVIVGGDDVESVVFESAPTVSECGSSPARSDLGYESLDSPLSGSEMDTTWEQNVSELFPSLF